MDVEPPSGQQVEIAHGDQTATIVEVGGGIRTYDIDGQPVIDGYDVDTMCSAARGQPLIPWPNRVAQGKYEWDGRSVQAPINEPDKGNAIHGFTRWMNWVPRDISRSGVTMTLRLHPLQGYPFALDLMTRYELADDGLTVTTTARNVGRSAAPYGHGAHPYLTVGTETVDEAHLHVPGRTYLPTDEKTQIPTGRVPVEGTAFDFRKPRAIGSAVIDHAFAELERVGGRCTATLSAPGGSRRVQMWADEHYRYLQVFTGDTVPEPERRRRGLGFEPMTCPPNAFATGEDVIRLEPREEIITVWGISPS